MSLIEHHQQKHQEQIQNDYDSQASEIPEFIRQDVTNLESETEEDTNQNHTVLSKINCKNVINNLLEKFNINQSGDGPFINGTCTNEQELISNTDDSRDSEIIVEQSETHIVDLNDYIDKDRKKKNVIEEMKNRFSPKSDKLLNESINSESVSSISEDQEELTVKIVDVEVKKSTEKPSRPPPPVTTKKQFKPIPQESTSTTSNNNRCTRKCSIQFFDIKSKIQQFEKIHSIKQTESQKSIQVDDCAQTALKVKDLKSIFEN